MQHIDLADLIGNDTTLTKAGKTDGGEYAGPCPFCGGKDRFRVWPAPREGKPRYWCRRCGRRGDAIQYLRDRYNLTYSEALARLGHATTSPSSACNQPPHPEVIAPPPAQWQCAASAFVEECQAHLWSALGLPARKWLRGRLFSRENLLAASIGYNTRDRLQERADWGLEPLRDELGRTKRVWLPSGIVIPWEMGKALWRVNIRRLADSGQGPKYIGPPGCAVGLYGADELVPGRAAVLVEGEFDALTVSQDAGHMAVAVATGSTTGARRMRWIARLALAPVVLIAFDADDAGEQASRYWCDLLPNARRWRPFCGKDVNEMAVMGGDIAAWVEAGLAQAGAKGRRSH